jgi:hypothetical protein
MWLSGGEFKSRGGFHFSLNKIIPRKRVIYNHYNLTCTIQFQKLQENRKFLASGLPSSASSVSYSTVASFWKATFQPFCYYAIKHLNIHAFVLTYRITLRILIHICRSCHRRRDLCHLSATGNSQVLCTWTTLSTQSMKYKVSAITCTNWIYIYIYI